MTADSPATPAPEISLVEAVWRYRLMSVLIVLACGLAAVGATQLLFGSAQARARFAVTDPTNTNSLHMGVVSGAGYATYTAQRAAFAQSAPVLKRASDIIAGGNGPRFTLEQMRASVHTASKPDGGVVEVTASGSSVAIAATKANAVVQGYQELTAQAISGKRDAQLKAINNAEKKVAGQLAVTKGKDATSLAANLAKLQTQESQLLADDAGSNDGVQFVDQADPTASAASKLPQNAVIGLAVGVLIACVVSFLRASAPARLGGAGGSWRPASSRRPAQDPEVAARQAAESERAARLAEQAEWANLARQAERAELAERARRAMAAEQAKQADLALQSEQEPPTRVATPESEEEPSATGQVPWLESTDDHDEDAESVPGEDPSAKTIRTSRLMHYYDADR